MAAPLDTYAPESPFVITLGYGGPADDGQFNLGPAVGTLGWGEGDPGVNNLNDALEAIDYYEKQMNFLGQI